MFSFKSIFKKIKPSFDLFVKIFRDIWYFRSAVIVILSPLLLLPLVIVADSKQSRCMYAVLIMASYWITEALPLAVTAMLPLFLFPVLGILPAKKVAAEYIQDPTFLFLGGFLIAMAIEKAKIHRRLAMRAILIVGPNPKCILIAIMITTAFLSMWMSNTATTAMMLPIVEAILIELVKDNRSQSKNATKNSSVVVGDDNVEKAIEQPFILKPESLSVEELNLCKMMFLSICYSSNIGGIGTLTGTPTNIIAVGMIERLYGTNTGVTFASWMGFAIPLTILNLIFTWFLLLLFFYGFKKTFTSEKGNRTNVLDGIRSNYSLLGPLNFHQIIVSFLFILIVLLWAFRSPKVIPGWGDFFEPGYISDATSAIFIAFLLFILPSSLPDFLCFKTRKVEKAPEIRPALLDWPTVQSKFPWGLIFLIGGGFAMAAAIEGSGLSQEIGRALSSLSHVSPLGICAIASVLATFATEVTTNMGVVSILAPILSAVAEKLEINPLYFVLTVTVCVSYAFMLPIATPPNAIVFGYGYIRVIDMIKIGFFLNWFAIGVTLLAINTWASHIFDLGTFPLWACRGNCTHFNATVFHNITN